VRGSYLNDPRRELRTGEPDDDPTDREKLEGVRLAIGEASRLLGAEGQPFVSMQRVNAARKILADILKDEP
jgi:hypothetical protein